MSSTVRRNDEDVAQRTSRRFHVDGSAPAPAASNILVFGSNLAGRHGLGSAKLAVQKYGARYGVGTGLVGRSYGIPTKNEFIRTLPLETIEAHVKAFIAHASAHPENLYHVTRIGCGLAGYKDTQIAPMFIDAPSNCSFAENWEKFLGEPSLQHDRMRPISVQVPQTIEQSDEDLHVRQRHRI